MIDEYRYERSIYEIKKNYLYLVVAVYAHSAVGV